MELNKIGIFQGDHDEENSKRGGICTGMNRVTPEL